MGAGVAGIETAFALIIIGAYVFGSTFGALLGALTLLTSAIIGGGIGPWLPFQILAASLVGLGAGLLPNYKNYKIRVAILCVYAAISSYVYGALMTLWTWPLFVGSGTSISFTSEAPLLENTIRFFQFELVSGGLLWDTGRAITTITLIALTGKALMIILERATTRADYSEVMPPKEAQQEPQ